MCSVHQQTNERHKFGSIIFSCICISICKCDCEGENTVFHHNDPKCWNADEKKMQISGFAILPSKWGAGHQRNRMPPVIRSRSQAKCFAGVSGVAFQGSRSLTAGIHQPALLSSSSSSLSPSSPLRNQQQMNGSMVWPRRTGRMDRGAVQMPVDAQEAITRGPCLSRGAGL